MVFRAFQMQFEYAEYVVEGILMLVVASIGVLLNILSIFYFSLLHQQKTFHRLLLLLSIVDTVHLICSSLTFSIPYLSSDYSETTWMYLVPYSLPLAQTSLTASVYLTISLTMERFFSVVTPFWQFRHRWFLTLHEINNILIIFIPFLIYVCM